MGLSIEQAQQFITDCEKARDEWFRVAQRSWREVNKQLRQRNLWSVTPNSARRRVRFPLWWSTFKIRKPLLYSRTPVVIGKDSTGGDDPTGRTAAVCLERLAKNIMASFDFDSAMQSGRDDALVTNVGTCRAFYDSEPVEEPAQIRVTQKALNDGTIEYRDVSGKAVDAASVQEDEEGPYIETSKTVAVENEKVYLEHLHYGDIYIDPDATHWGKVAKIGFGFNYTLREFKKLYGDSAVGSLPSDNIEEFGKKRQPVRVFEMWDLLERKVYWFAQGGKEFLKPVKAQNELEQSDTDIYGLQKFFPVVPPMVWNAPTDSFYPVPEYFQLQDLIEDIHNLFSQMFAVTKAIRPRFLYDESVTELKPLINEVGTADGIGVPNLQQSLAGGKGDLGNLVKYLPIGEMIQALENLYKAFSQRLDLFYQLTGTSDLLRGQTDQVERTYGEQQLKAKYSLNQTAEPQRDMQRFARDNVELLCEMALKNFSDESLGQYIVPSTLDEEDKQRYGAALELLKNDRKRRFRIELETDSTIALNEAYDKAARVEIANALSTALEKTVAIAKEDKSLAVAELKLLLHLIRGFRQGKLFEDEVTQAIQSAIDRAEAAAAQQPPPDPNLLLAEAEQMKAQTADKKLCLQFQADAAKDKADYDFRFQELLQKAKDTQNQLQLDYTKLQQDYEKAVGDFSLKREELLILREKNSIDASKAGNDTLLKQTRLDLDKQIAASESQLALMAQNLEQYKVALDEKEKYMTENRLQFESQLEQIRTQVDAARAQQLEARSQAAAPMPPVQLMMPREEPMMEVSNVIRDAAGNIVRTEKQKVPIPQAL